MNRIGEVWEAGFNGYPIRGEIVRSTLNGYRYAYYPEGKYEVWIHYVKIIASEKQKDLHKTYKWKEDGSSFDTDRSMRKISAPRKMQWSINPG